MTGKPSQVRLYCILARAAPLAVVFRRGPSKRVLLLRWHTDTDKFEEGQWFKGRIYERRCDLSPSGERLIYFAATYKQPYFSWTAISKPPFLTAVALWPKGDGWGGGGLFETERKIRLNHREAEMELAEGFTQPRKVRVESFGERPGWGEDSPIIDTRLSRDGWQLLQQAMPIEHSIGAAVWMEWNPPEIWSRAHPRRRYELRMSIKGLHERDGAWYIVEHSVEDKKTGSVLELGRTDWADWCHSGDLLFAKQGKLFRLGFSAGGTLAELADARLLIDLNGHTFKEVAAPDSAKQWD